jgi:transcriptional regulator with XRE-family HTH domain
MHRSYFGKTLRKLRQQRGLTQERLASLSHLERTFISMLERGIKQPSLNTIASIAQALDIRIHELLHLVEQEIHAAIGKVSDAQDIDLESRQLAALEEEEEKSRIREIANYIPVVFFSRTPMPEYAATFVSSNIEQLLGFDRESFMGSSGFWLDRIHPEDRIKVRNCLERIQVNVLVNHEYRLLAANGTWVRIREELRSVADAQGTPKEVLGSMTGDFPETTTLSPESLSR